MREDRLIWLSTVLMSTPASGVAMSTHHSGLRSALVAGLALALAGPAAAFTITLSSADFTKAPVFNDYSSFTFSIDIAGPLLAGSYVDPALNGVNYSVHGVLASPTPSGFTSFALVRSIGGAEFYSQGSSLRFTIDAGAALTDGLQLNELSGTDPVLIFNGRELNTGRYHPALLELRADGSGRIQNSNNSGGINPGSGRAVNVGFGDEYIVDLTASPNLTLAVPEPASALMLSLGVAGLGILGWRRRNLRP